MTGMRRWRKLTRGLVIFSFIWEAVVTIVSLVLLMLATVLGKGAPFSDRLIPVVATLALYAVLIWAIWDARRRTCRHSLAKKAAAEEV